MNAISVDIVKSLFMPIFVLTTLSAAGLVVLGLTRWGQTGSAFMAIAGAAYVLGMFGVPIMFNEPLNDALAAADPVSPQAAALWSRYLTDWTMWNHVQLRA